MRHRSALHVSLLVLVLVGLAACQRGEEAPPEGGVAPTATLPLVATPPTPELGPGNGGEVLLPPVDGGGFGQGGEVTPAPAEPLATPVGGDPGFGGRFSDLRFTNSGNGQPQANFPEGIEEIYAIWNYDGMSATDTMERLWYHNDVLYVEKKEAWDFAKYGSTGAVRDVFLYDYIDGIDPGTYRVEIYLNGEQKMSETFTVGGP